MERPGWPVGRLESVRAATSGATSAGGLRLEVGRLPVVLVVDRLPVGDLPPGARLRIGEQAIIQLGPVSPAGAAAGGIVETGEARARPAEVLEGGLVEPGAAVTLEAVALPVTEVLDLHSFQAQDVPAVVSEYLAEARRAGFVEVRIVHGRGRGVQRAVVRRLLAEVPGVAGFADASPARGGWGATVVQLRRAVEAPPR